MARRAASGPHRDPRRDVCQGRRQVVEADRPASHAKLGWQGLTDALIAVAAMVAKVWVGRRASGLRAVRVTLGTDMPVKPLWAQVRDDHEGTRELRRNFYGTLRVREQGSGDQQVNFPNGMPNTRSTNGARKCCSSSVLCCSFTSTRKSPISGTGKNT